MESKEELEAKIVVYQEQLQQINDLLLKDSANEQLTKIKTDLEKVIQLTSSLVHSSFEDGENYQETGESSVSPKAGVNCITDFNIGDKVEVVTDERKYAAVVLAVNSESGNCTIKYFEYEAEVELPVNRLMKISPGEYESTDIHPPGFKCQCKYAQDQRWYDVTVDAITEHGFMVTYTQYGQTEEVPVEYLRPLQSKKSKEKSKSDGPTLINIPESLKILPTDTEAVIAYKYRQ